MDFEVAVDLAREARARGWEVSDIHYRYREDGKEVWSVSVRTSDDATAPRDELMEIADYTRLAHLDCSHPRIILTPASDGSYGGMAECAACGRRVGFDRQSAPTVQDSNRSYGLQIAPWIAQVRSWLHTQDMQREPPHDY